jgi:hypothetical protein
VVAREIGRQRVSAARWIFVLNPPRERPNASRVGSGGSVPPGSAGFL